MGTTLKVSLSSDSLLKAASEVEKYRKSLDEKCKMFVEELAKVGIEALNAHIGSISPFYKGSDLTSSLGVVENTGDGWRATVEMSGSQALFVEFGAGVTFNTGKGGSLHPKGVELGYTIGSYNPDSKNATNPWGWWYKDEWGTKQHTYGTPTFAPMYHSSEEMIKAIVTVAKSVFGTNEVIRC